MIASNVTTHCRTPRGVDIYIISFVANLYKVFIPRINFLSAELNEDDTILMSNYYATNTREHLDVINDVSNFSITTSEADALFTQFDNFGSLATNEQNALIDECVKYFNLQNQGISTPLTLVANSTAFGSPFMESETQTVALLTMKQTSMGVVVNTTDIVTAISANNSTYAGYNYNSGTGRDEFRFNNLQLAGGVDTWLIERITTYDNGNITSTKVLFRITFDNIAPNFIASEFYVKMYNIVPSVNVDTVTFQEAIIEHVVDSGGSNDISAHPYTMEWDLNGDNVSDATTNVIAETYDLNTPLSKHVKFADLSNNDFLTSVAVKIS